MKLWRLAPLAALSLCQCGGCGGCSGCNVRGSPRGVLDTSSDASPLPSTSPSASASLARRAPTSAASVDAPLWSNASAPTWPPQGPGCEEFAACCSAATPQPAAKTVCMLSYNESLDCMRAKESFVRKLKALNAPLPDVCCK